jgi:phthalate 4,5-dioxygenase oxygenase subunit
VSEQDACIQDSQGYIADRTREHLGPTDIGVVRFRRCILGSAKDLAAGKAPAAAQQPGAYRVRSGSAVAHGSTPFEQVMQDRFGHPYGLVGSKDKETA